MVSDFHSSIIALGRRSYTPNYHPRDVVFKYGQGSILWDLDDQEYLDFGTGIGVNCLGHRNAELVSAVAVQSENLWHTSNVYFNETTVRLATEIIEQTFAENVFFCNSGAEANEAAIKAARKYAHDNCPPEKRIVISFKGSFHGRTLATVAATAQPKYQEGFTPLPQGFRYCEFADIDSFTAACKPDVCAVILEPIQGEGGIRPFPSEYLRYVRQMCSKHDITLIVDEVQSGIGRTGKLFAYEWTSGFEPDIVTVAKALGGGLPIGAVLFGSKMKDTMQLGSHGSTFGGNPMCCASARVVFRKVNSANFLSEIKEKGEYLRNCLMNINRNRRYFTEIRGKGLMVGAEFQPKYGDCAGKVMEKCLQEKLMILQSGPNVMRLLPAYTISKTHIHSGMKTLEKVLSEMLS